MTKCILGIDIGKSNIRVAVSEGTPELKYYCKQPYRSATPREFEDQLVAAIDRAMVESGYSRDSIAAIGIDVPATGAVFKRGRMGRFSIPANSGSGIASISSRPR